MKGDAARVSRPEAVLLIGPTGSGKTPLGALLERRGLAGRRCHHFDFGEELRAVAAGGGSARAFGADEVALVRELLATGTLLEDQDFGLAEKMFRAFRDRREPAAGDLVVLNGLPRHAGQAGDVARLVDVREVVYLRCTAGAVLERIRADAGGDRAGRVDDGAESVERKLEIFRRRTEPLVEHYRRAGAAIREVDVGPDTSPEDVVTVLETTDDAAS